MHVSPQHHTLVIFTGAGDGVFIAHYDAGELVASTESQDWLQSLADPTESHDLHRLILMMRRSRLITVAAINGSTVGGGLEFALGCDFRLAMDGPYEIGPPETNTEPTCPSSKSSRWSGRSSLKNEPWTRKGR